jgi:hypothetical protein
MSTPADISTSEAIARFGLCEHCSKVLKQALAAREARLIAVVDLAMIVYPLVHRGRPGTCSESERGHYQKKHKPHAAHAEAGPGIDPVKDGCIAHVFVLARTSPGPRI